MDKAYIVANKQQEMAVLDKLERDGVVWVSGGEKPTEWSPSDAGKIEKATFPYVLINRGDVRWSSLNIFDNDATVVYDGRNEEQMSEKYIVSQEFMDELENSVAQGRFVSVGMLSDLPDIINNWRITRENNESNNRLIAIIRWVNGEDVFEVKKWVVRSKERDSEGDYWYVRLDGNEYNKSNVGYDIETATRFDTKEEAESWANSHQEVVEAEE